MLVQCDECNDHRLMPEDFEKTLPASHSDSDSEEREFDRSVGFYEWNRGDNCFMMKSQVTLSTEDGLTLWNSKVQRRKEHIFTKRQQQSGVSYLKVNINVNEVLIHLQSWNKMGKSSKTGRGKKSLISTFVCFLTAAAGV